MMISKKTIILVAGTIVLVPSLALAQAAEPNALDVPRLAHETRAELMELGCDEVDLANEQELLAARSLSWQVVLPPDAADQSVILCPQAVINGLQPLREGQVKALTAHAQDPGGGAAQAGATQPSEPGLNPIARFIIWLLNNLSLVGVRLLSAFLRASMLLLPIGGFLSNNFVATGWPIVLGIANLGFMLALVLIALLVTLRLDDGGGVRRLLPRFLLGALLVNFSLIIGVLLIDFSRLIMAVLLSFFGYGDPGALLTAFQKEIKVAEIVTQLGSFFSAITNETSDYAGTGQVVGAILMVLVVFALAGGALVVFVGLLLRFLVLAVLLVLSPFAYLFVAFPNTSNLAKLWWKQFFRYVFYAPVVLMILILTAKMAESSLWDDLVVFIPLPGDPERSDIDITMKMLAQRAAIAVGLMVAAGSGRWAGIVGSAAAMSAVSRAGARGKGMYLRGLRRGGRVAAAPVRGAVGRAGAYAGGAWAAARERYPFLRRVAPTREQLRAAGRGRVERRTGMLPPVLRARSRDEQTRANAAVGAARGAAPGVARGTLPTMSRQNLANSYVGARIAREAKGSMADVAQHSNREEVQTMVRNAAIVRELDDGEQMDLITRINANTNFRPVGGGLTPAQMDKIEQDIKNKLTEELHKTIAKVQGGPGAGTP